MRAADAVDGMSDRTRILRQDEERVLKLPYPVLWLLNELHKALLTAMTG